MAFEIPIHLRDSFGSILWAKSDPAAVKLLIDCSNSYVHPVFARDRWDDVSDADYLRMSPSLVLATNIIASSHSLHFWHALLFAPQTPMKDTDGKTRLRFDRVEASSTQPLPVDQAEAVRNILLEMTQVVNFKIKDLHDESRYGLTWLRNGDFLYEGGPGVYSSITINKSLIDEIDLRTLALASLMRRWFLVAMILCHEMAHAVSAARYGVQHEMFFEDDGFIELGFAFEKYQIGGFRVKMDWGTQYERLAVYRQPDPRVLAAYLPNKPRGFPVSVEVPKEPELIRYLRDEWIQELFFRSYWNALG